MIFANEIFETIKIGDRKKGYVKKNREDGKLDISLNPIGQTHNIAYNKVLERLEQKKEIELNSKSNPEEIKKEFGISKKGFKSAIQELLKDDKIEVNEDGIKLK